jgi:hypothetical protein
MRLPNFKRIVSSDYDAQFKPIIERLGNSINIGIETINDALNGKLNFKDNVASTISTVGITVGADGIPVRPTSIKLTVGQTTVEGVMVINAYGTKNPNILPYAGVFVAFNKNEGSIDITNVKGLIADIPYTIKLIILA